MLRETSCCLERKTDSRDILCNGLILQLALTPHALFDVGFQLSYLAMSGITFLFPILNKWYHGKIWESCALSISCQVFTGPLAYLKFGSLPLYFMLTNLISIPLTKDEDGNWIVPRKGDKVSVTRYGETFELTVDNADPSQLGGVSIYATRSSW